MSDVNKVLLLGRLTADPELRYLPKGTAVVEISVAVNRRWKSESGEEKEEVSFIRCAAFGRVAETIGQHFAKGRPIFIDGRLRQESWDDKTTGQKRSALKVMIESFTFVGNKPVEGDTPRSSAPVKGKPPATSTGPVDPPVEDDVPF